MGVYKETTNLCIRRKWKQEWTDTFLKKQHKLVY